MKPEISQQIPVPGTRRPLWFIVFVLSLSLLLLTSCALLPAHTTVSEPPPPAGFPDNLTCEIELESDNGASRSDDGVMLAAFNYQIPVMRIYRRNGAPVTAESAASTEELNAVNMADTFNRAFEEWEQQADFLALEALARQDYALRKQDNLEWNYHYEQGLESSLYQTNRFVSIAGRFYYYAGGAHPNTVLLGWNYDLEKGEFFYAGQLFENTEAVTEELLRMARERAAERNMAPEEFFWEDYADILREWNENSAVVTFDESYMTISFSPYDLASYAAGEQVFTFSRAWIAPYLNQYGAHILS